jgi:hypothetical protein
MDVTYKLVKFDEGTYLTARVGGVMFVSTKRCDEWIHIPLLASNYEIKGEILTLNVGHGILITLRKKDLNSSKL